MNEEIRFFLNEGPHTVADLARLTSRSQSGIRLILKQHEDEISVSQNSTGAKTYFIKNAGTSIPDPSGVESSSEGEGVGLPASEPEIAPAAPLQAKKDGRGRKPNSHGKNLVAKVETNPRRPNSHGFRSLQIILDNPNISAEEFVAKGGRHKDLRWDIAFGRVEAI